MNKVLIISELHLIKTFILPTISKLKACAYVQFDCLIVTKVNKTDIIELYPTFTNVFYNKYPSKLFSKIPKLRFFQYIYGLRKAAQDLSDYDIAHVNFLHYYYAFFTPIIRKKVKIFYITFYGSDFNHTSRYRHYWNKKSTDIADKIFVTENPDFLTQIAAKYKIRDVLVKTGVLFPLMSSFELFEIFSKSSLHQHSKTVLGIAAKRLMVCGYNAAPIVQHEEIIKVLIRLKEHLTDYTIIFPMTYGHMGNITRPRVKSLLKNSGLDYQVLKEFLPNEKLLALRFAADIFIHIQSRDQMASSMLEHMAAGSVVITGKWLPYDSLKELGVYFIQINKIEDLHDALLNIIENLDIHLQKCKQNREIILGLVSWHKNKWSWYNAYNLNEK